VRTLQEFLAFFTWDDQRARDLLQRRVAEHQAHSGGIGVIDASGHAKQGRQTPGVARQYCGETGKLDNCVVGQHLLYTDNDAQNPFAGMLASDLYLPEEWASDRPRCQKAGIPAAVVYRPKWRIAIEQVTRALGNGVRFTWLTFDEDYGSVPEFWFELDRLGQRAIGEVRANFCCWPKRPACRSQQAAHAARRVDHVARHSPAFRTHPWEPIRIKHTTRGLQVWEVQAARVHLTNAQRPVSEPTDRLYWLIVARQPRTGEIKYLVSNAPGRVPLRKLLQAAFARWHVEKWFERAKQEAGLGAFEVRTYTSLIRHWFCSGLAMYFLALQTQRLRGGKSGDHVGAGGRGGERSGRRALAPPRALTG
jgi:SRSO17 transposase